VNRPARQRLIAAAILGIVAALAAFVVMITIRYRDGLEQRLRADLTSGANALSAAHTPEALKSLTGSLAAEGISVDLAGITAKGATLQTITGGALLTVHELIPVDGSDLPATLTGSRAGIDHQVRSLEVTEAIGGVIALALLIALARVLVLLDRALSEARASEAAMRTFLADASHELRTPVAALQATAERLLRDQPPRPARDTIEAQLARPQPAQQRVRGRRHGRDRSHPDSDRYDDVGDRQRTRDPCRSARTDLRAVRPPSPKPARRHRARARDRAPDDRITRRHDHVQRFPDRRRAIHPTTTRRSGQERRA
jgi:signal transduction histidine kinase